MSSKIVVRCSQGCKVVVNLDKHKDRDYVFCPKHKEKIKVRKEHFFSPRPDWEEEKERRRDARLTMKSMKRTPSKEGVPTFMPSVPGASEVMARVILIQYQLERERREKKNE